MAEQPKINIQRTSKLNGINFLGKTLSKVGLDPFRLNANKVIEKAKRKSNYKAGLPEHIRTGLTTMVDFLNRDAKVIVTHRHPSYVVPSAAKLISYMRSLYSYFEDQKRTRHETADLWRNYFKSFVET